MTSKKKTKRPSSRPRRTAIVPRVVFQTLVAVSVVPAATVLAGCGQTTTQGGTDSGFSVVAVRDAGRDSGTFSVALPIDAGHDSGTFSVAVPIDGGHDSAMFGVADVGPAPQDAGQDAGNDAGVIFGVAVPLDGAFSVIIAPLDASS